MTLVSFTSDATEATSVVVDVGSPAVMRVTHYYHPSAATPDLYQVDVKIENVSGSPINVLYRRVMDWDVEPTAFSEYVTLQRGTAANIIRTDNNGFNSANPFSFSSFGQLNVDFTDNGAAGNVSTNSFRVDVPENQSKHPTGAACAVNSRPVVGGNASDGGFVALSPFAPIIGPKQ